MCIIASYCKVEKGAKIHVRILCVAFLLLFIIVYIYLELMFTFKTV